MNGKITFDGLLTPRVATLLRWAARDDDRSMLFGVELAVTVGAGHGGTVHERR